VKAVAVLALACAAFVAAPATAAAPKPKTVRIADNYYLPAKLTIKHAANTTKKVTMN